MTNVNDDNICISFNGDIDEFRQLKQGYKLIEIRMDLCNLSTEEYKEVFASDITTIATSKSNQYIEQLKFAAKAGADYLDIDIATNSFELLLDVAKKNKCKTILSYHNYELTPPRKRLLSIISRCVHYHADICKIVCMPTTIKDVLRMMRLYTCDEISISESTELIAFAMNKIGRISRVAAMEFGAPFMYCAVDKDSRTAAGQFTAEQLQAISLM